MHKNSLIPIKYTPDISADSAPLQTLQPATLPDTTEPRFSAVVILDTSASMSSLMRLPNQPAFRPIERLNQSFAAFPSHIADDDLVAKYAELAVISCGGRVAVAQSFVPVGRLQIRPFIANGGTPLGEALLAAIHLIQQRQSELESLDVDTLRPFVFVITDGQPTDAPAIITEAGNAIRTLEAERRMAFFAAVTHGTDASCLERMFVRRPLPLCDFNYGAMFRWFAKSISIVTHSRPGDEISLPNPIDFGWTRL